MDGDRPCCSEFFCFPLSFNFCAVCYSNDKYFYGAVRLLTWKPRTGFLFLKVFLHFFFHHEKFSSNTSPRIPILIFGSLLPPSLLPSRSQNLQLSLRDEVLFSDMAMIVERCVTSYILFIVYHLISNSFRPMRAREVLQTSQKYYIMYKILSHIYTFH